MCKLTNYTPCRDFNVGGLKKIHVIDYGKIEGYQYATNSNLKYITSYNPLDNFVSYDILSGSLVESSDVANMFVYNHTLKVSIPTRSAQFQSELEKLNNRKLTIIVEDKNNKSWIIGKNAPCYISSFNCSSDNQFYDVTFSSTTSNTLEEIVTIDKDCFSSFKIQQLRSSVFTLIDAASIDWSGLLQIVADTTNLSYLPTVAFDLTNPLLQASNIATLESLISNYTNSRTISYYYDNATDTVTLRIDSLDTTFDYFTLGGISYRSAIDIRLQANLSLSNAIVVTNPTVTVRDGVLNVLYTGALTDDITDMGLSGTVESALIDVNMLYPNGTSLVFAVDGTFNCQTIGYTYTVEPTSQCGIVKNMKYLSGRRYTLLIPSFPTNTRFRRLEWNFDGYIFIQNPTIGQHHSSFPQFISDLNNLLGNYAQFFSLQSYNDYGTYVEIIVEDARNYTTDTFAANINVCHYGYNNGSNSVVSDSLQSRLMRIETFTNSNIIYTDTFGNTLTNQPTFTNNGFDLQNRDNISPINQSVYDILYDTNKYNETQFITARYSSLECPTINAILKPDECIGNQNSSEIGHYYLISLEDYVLGTSFTFEFNTNTFNYTTANPIYGDDVTGLITLTSGNNNVFVIKSMRYCNFTNKWLIEIITKDVSIELIEVRANTLAQTSVLIDEFVVTNLLTTFTNANNNATYQLTTPNPYNAVVSSTSPIGYPIRHDYNRIEQLLSFTCDGTDLVIDVLCLNYSGIDIELRDGSNSTLLTYNIPLGTYNITFPFSSDLSSIGVSISDISQVMVTELLNNEQWGVLHLIDINNNSTYINKEYQTLCAWGTLDNLNVLHKEDDIVNYTLESNSLSCNKWRMNQLYNDGFYHRSFNIDSGVFKSYLYNPYDNLTVDTKAQYNYITEKTSSYSSWEEPSYNVLSDVTSGTVSFESKFYYIASTGAGTLMAYGNGSQRSFTITFASQQLQIRVGNGYSLSDLYVRYPFTNAMFNNTMVHLVITFNGFNASGVNVYVNGSLLTSKTIVTNSLASISQNPNSRWHIGDFVTGYYSGVAPFLGNIYKAALYNKTLNIDEVVELYNENDVFSLDNNRIFDAPFTQREGTNLVNTATLLTTPVTFAPVGIHGIYGDPTNKWAVNNNRFIYGYPINVNKGFETFNTDYAPYMDINTFITFYDNGEVSQILNKPYWYKIIGINGNEVRLNTKIVEDVSGRDMFLATIDSIDNPNQLLNVYKRNGIHTTLVNAIPYKDGGKRLLHKNINRIGGLKYDIVSSYNPNNLNFICVIEPMTFDSVIFSHGDSIKVYYNGTNVYTSIFDGSATQTLLLGTMSAGLNIIHFSFAKDLSTITIKGSVNGSTVATTSFSNNNNPYFNSSDEYIGTTKDTLSIKKTGSFNMYDIFKGVTPLNQNTIDKCVGYFAHFHDLTAKLPLTHTYKVTEPTI